MSKAKKEVHGFETPDVGKLVFDVNIELLLAQAKERSIQEYNSWWSVIGTFMEEIENLKKKKK